MSSSKRVSTAPAAPKPPVHFAPVLIIADNATLTGTNLISIGLHTVIHPRAKLNSTYGPITIGSNCVISERSQIGFQNPLSNSQSQGVFIENGVVVETGAIVEARKVGEGSVIEVNARIGKGAILGKVLLLMLRYEIQC
jgi:dynactin-6